MRAWIIGNGPSLRQTPLALLTNENTFGVNAIHLAYEWTDWRPKSLVWTDYAGYTNGTEIIEAQAKQADNGIRCFFRYDYAFNIEPARKSPYPFVHYIKTCFEHVHCDVNSPRRPEAWHFPQVCRYGGSVAVAMQLAVLEGYNPIILLGCDLGYREPRPGEPDPNHFHPDYHSHTDFTWESRDPTLIHAHQQAKRYCDEHGIVVLNATLGGLLEVYPRISLEKALCL